MPELPDVEYFKSYFDRTALHKTITYVQCGDADVIENVNCSFLRRALHGKEFDGTRRRGKFLIVNIADSEYNVVFHFGMTGYFSASKIENRPEEEEGHAHVIIQFKDGYELRWICVRKLGAVYFVKDPTEIDLIAEMGPEPLDMSEYGFLKLLSEHQNKNTKSFLMDQRDIAGIGNEYSDEILFRAEIDPHRKIGDLSMRERKRLYTITIKTLEDAIEVGPPRGTFDNSWVIVHHSDLTCPKNEKHTLKKEKIAGRSAVWCPKHQQ